MNLNLPNNQNQKKAKKVEIKEEQQQNISKEEFDKSINNALEEFDDTEEVVYIGRKSKILEMKKKNYLI